MLLLINLWQKTQEVLSNNIKVTVTIKQLHKSKVFSINYPYFVKLFQIFCCKIQIAEKIK